MYPEKFGDRSFVSVVGGWKPLSRHKSAPLLSLFYRYIHILRKIRVAQLHVVTVQAEMNEMRGDDPSFMMDPHNT